MCFTCCHQYEGREGIVNSGKFLRRGKRFRAQDSLGKDRRSHSKHLFQIQTPELYIQKFWVSSSWLKPRNLLFKKYSECFRNKWSNIYKQLIQLNIKIPTQWKKKKKNGQKKQTDIFSKEKMQMANKHMKICSASLNIREMQIKTMRYHLSCQNGYQQVHK